jgi:hypothetical protein
MYPDYFNQEARKAGKANTLLAAAGAFATGLYRCNVVTV